MTALTWRAVAELLTRHHLDVAEPSITDAYGVTYTGAVAELTLIALARPDLSPDLTSRTPSLDDAPHANVRWAARTLLRWFTSEYTDPGHAAALYKMPFLSVCQMVALLAGEGPRATLERVGPQSLATYTRYLTTEPLAEPAERRAPFPTATDPDGGGLGDIGPVALRMTTTHGLVGVAFTFNATEEIGWDNATGVTYLTPGGLNSALCAPHGMTRHLTDDADLIGRCLDYRTSHDRGGGQQVDILSYRPAPPVPDETPPETPVDNQQTSHGEELGEATARALLKLIDTWERLAHDAKGLPGVGDARTASARAFTTCAGGLRHALAELSTPPHLIDNNA